MGFTLSANDRKLLRGVHPALVRVIERAAQIAPFPFRITEGLRSIERQRQLVAAGASKTMNSRHLDGHAVDLVPLVDLNDNGKFETDELYHWPLYYKLAPIVKEAARLEGVPIEWGGDWRTFKDGPHWQLPYKQFPSAKKFAAVEGAPPYTDETETGALVRNGSVAAAGAAGATLAAEDVVTALVSQQGEITSGDVVRVGFAIVIIAITAFMIYRRFR